MFVGIVSAEGAALSLLSKTSPPHLKSVVWNMGTITVFVGLFGRCVADFHIFAVEMSNKLINIDIVNSLVIPLLIGVFVCRHLVRKKYFFLI